MREAVIVSTARTGLAKSVRGGFNLTHGAALGGHAIKHAVVHDSDFGAGIVQILAGGPPRRRRAIEPRLATT